MNISDIDEVLDFVIFLLLLVIAFTTAILFIGMIHKDVQSMTLDDKTALYANNDNTPVDVVYDVPDILLSLVVADEYQPEPTRLLLNNDELVTFDQNYIKDTVSAITRTWNNHLKIRVGETVKEFQVKWDSAGNPYWSITTGR